MSAKTVRELLAEEDIALLIDMTKAYTDKCQSYGNRKSTGYGKVSEEVKKIEWFEKAKRAEELLSRICNEMS